MRLPLTTEHWIEKVPSAVAAATGSCGATAPARAANATPSAAASIICRIDTTPAALLRHRAGEEKGLYLPEVAGVSYRI